MSISLLPGGDFKVLRNLNCRDVTVVAAPPSVDSTSKSAPRTDGGFPSASHEIHRAVPPPKKSKVAPVACVATRGKFGTTSLSGPPTWFLTTVTVFAAKDLQVCCTLLPIGIHRVYSLEHPTCTSHTGLRQSLPAMRVGPLEECHSFAAVSLSPVTVTFLPFVPTPCEQGGFRRSIEPCAPKCAKSVGGRLQGLAPQMRP
jgi:hypothetical protein